MTDAISSVKHNRISHALRHHQAHVHFFCHRLALSTITYIALKVSINVSSPFRFTIVIQFLSLLTGQNTLNSTFRQVTYLLGHTVSL